MKEIARVRTENSQGGDLRTLKTNSQGRDPRTLKEPLERWRPQKKAKKEVEEEKWEKEKEETGEARKSKLVEKVQRKDRTFLHGEDQRRKERKRRPKEKQTSQGETSPGEVWKMALSPFAIWAELAVCHCCSGRIAEKDGDDGKDEAPGSSSQREQMDGGDSTKGPGRTEMRKEDKRLRCILLTGSAWNTEKKYMRRYKGTFVIFLGIEHRLRKEDLEEQ